MKFEEEKTTRRQGLERKGMGDPGDNLGPDNGLAFAEGRGGMGRGQRWSSCLWSMNKSESQIERYAIMMMRGRSQMVRDIKMTAPSRHGSPNISPGRGWMVCAAARVLLVQDGMACHFLSVCSKVCDLRFISKLKESKGKA